MRAKESSLWGIILAGGEGRRLREYVYECTGTDAPKQFCAFVGSRSMLERTVRRARLLIPSRRLVVSGTAHHRLHLLQSLNGRFSEALLLQPRNRDTAPGILLPLLLIVKADPTALVAIFPSDHFVLPGRRLMHTVGQAAAYIRRTHSEYPVVLGAEATYPETEYGWLAPGAFLTSEEAGSIFRVQQFVEKPAHEDAVAMLRQKWLWNTMVLVARAASLLDLIRELHPDLVACCEILQHYVGSNREQVMTEEVYRIIPSVNFSTAVLARRPDRLLGAEVRQIRWSDWGNKERILRTIASLRERRHKPLVPEVGAGLTA